MRFHIGRRFGKTYAGMSFGGGGRNKQNDGPGLFLTLLLIPFFFVIPFIWLFQYFSGRHLKTWKMVILWICFFPILGIVALYKSNLNIWVKIGATAALAVILVAIAAIPKSEPKAEEPLDIMEAAATVPEATEPPARAHIEAPAKTPAPEAAPAMALSVEPVSTPEPMPEPEPTESPAELTQAGYVDADELNLRAEPSREGELLGEYTRGQTLEIVGEPGEWAHVRIGGADGYMLAEYVGLGDPPKAEAREPERETEAVVFAEVPAQEHEIINKQNYHGHVYTGGEGSKKYHYEAECAGSNSHEITWEEVQRSNLGPCGTCVLQ